MEFDSLLYNLKSDASHGESQVVVQFMLCILIAFSVVCDKNKQKALKRYFNIVTHVLNPIMTKLTKLILSLAILDYLFVAMHVECEKTKLKK